LGIINFLVSPGLGNPTLLPLLVHMCLPWLHWLALSPAELFVESTNPAHLLFRHVTHLDIFWDTYTLNRGSDGAIRIAYLRPIEAFFTENKVFCEMCSCPVHFVFRTTWLWFAESAGIGDQSIPRLSVAQNRKIVNVKVVVAHCCRTLSANRRLNVSGHTCQFAVASLLISLGG
jgi:hypothetical protein